MIFKEISEFSVWVYYWHTLRGISDFETNFQQVPEFWCAGMSFTYFGGAFWILRAIDVVYRYIAPLGGHSKGGILDCETHFMGFYRIWYGCIMAPF